MSSQVYYGAIIHNHAPSPEPRTRTRTLPPQEERCKAPTQDKRTKLHTGPQCARRKVLDTVKPQALKSEADLVADECCKQHKTMAERFAVRRFNPIS